jgi:serine phosphatase RsbU (regulator of sigma subunit)
MRILVAWDDASQAELLNLYLAAGENQVCVSLTFDDLLEQARRGDWDAILMALAFPTNANEGFALFQQLQEMLPGVPVVLACRTTEMLELPRFLTHGLRFYLIRDDRADFVFLVLSSLESAVAAARAEESRKLAERLREEMDGVRKLQESIIPHGLNPPPGYKIAARYEPSQVTVVGDRPVVMAGGDYYDIFRPDDRTLVVLIGDASGHGLKACMSIMAMHTLIRMFTGDRYRNTAAFVAEINQRLCENAIVQSGGGFITLFYAAIDTVSHTMYWTSAGHPFAQLHLLKGNDVVQVGTDADGGLPLGISPDLDYTAASLELPPDSRIMLYSDGLTDAFPMEGSGHMAFGVGGISDTLRACRAAPLDDALDKLFRASHAFTGGAGRHDDTSVVLLERHAD